MTTTFSSVHDEVNWLIEQRLVHSVHTSTRMSFRGCRRRWDWSTRQMYYPLVTPRPLEFGSAFHKAMEKYYDPLTWHDKETAAALAQAAFVQECKEQYSKYLKLNRGNIDPAMKKDYDERIVLGLGMLRYYTRWVSPEHDFNFTPVKVEIEFEVPITDPDDNYMWCKCQQCVTRSNAYWLKQYHSEGKLLHIRNVDALAHDTKFEDGIFYTSVSGKLVDIDDPIDIATWSGLPITYGGRIDMLAKDDLGRYWVFDWKTAARLAGKDAGTDDDFMYLDDQITSYCWALWRLGIPIAGFVYAEVKKAVPEEPEPNKTQRLGRWYSVNKQLATTAVIYERTVEENDPQAYAAGLYNDFIGYLKSEDGPKFHVRHQIQRSEAELRNAGVNIWHEACEMTSPTLRIYPSPGRFACGNCAYKEPCLMRNKDEDYEYTLKTMFEKRVKHYWEDRAPSTDSRGGQ